MHNFLSNIKTVIPHLMRDPYKYFNRFRLYGRNDKRVKHGMTQKGFIRLTKKALVMLLIFSILLPSIILYSLFILPKPAKAEWKDRVIVVAAVGAENLPELDLVFRSVKKRRELSEKPLELKFYKAGIKTKNLA